MERLLAHGVGGQADLPVPLSLAISGAVAALVLSFAVMAWAWREPRFTSPAPGRPAWSWITTLVDSAAFRGGLRVLGVLIAAYTALAAVAGRDSAINPATGIFYIYLWVGLVPLSFLLGPVYRALSPPRAIAWVLERLSGQPLGIRAYPQWLGYWPAVIGLFSFVWMELVKQVPTDVGGIRLWCTIYLATMLVGGAVFGEEWFARADPFEVYSTLVGKLSIWGRDERGVVLRSPLANLATVVPGPGLFAVVGTLLGSTAYDGFRESTQWVQFVQSSSADGRVLSNVALLVFCVAATTIFALGAMLTGARDEHPRTTLPGLFAHSIVPIIVGYTVAHYTTLLVESGQRYLAYLGDPLVRGDDLFGLADFQTNFWLSNHPPLVASIKVLAVVIGHVVAAIAAHDRALQVLPVRHQLTGQLTLLAVMIVFTGGGLYLLFSA